MVFSHGGAGSAPERFQARQEIAEQDAGLEGQDGGRQGGGLEREGWRLRREAAVIEAGRNLLIPDFVFTHADGTEVALEIVGYWTPEYLAAKLGKLRSVKAPNLLVAVRRSLALEEGALPSAVLPFKSRILLRDLLPRLEAFRR